MAITYIGSTARPDDNGAQAGPTSSGLILANAGGAITGDLVVIIAQYRGSVTLTLSETSGQTWTSETAYASTAADITARIFWCRWNTAAENGNNPVVSNGLGTLALTCVAHIFRPTSSSNLWAIDIAQSTAQFAAGSTPFTKTITGITTLHDSTVAVACWHSPDDNTWGSLSGTGWANLGGDNQYRNTTGNDQSSTFAYQIKTSVGATNDVSKNQATLGGDAGVSSIISWYEYSAGAISGTTTGTSSLSAALIAIGTLAASLTISPSQSGSLTANGALSSSITTTSSQSGTFSALGIMQAASAGTVSFSAGLIGAGQLSGNAVGSASEATTIAAVGNIITAVDGTSSAIGTLTEAGSGDITATSTGSSSIAANINADGSLSAVVNGTSNVSAMPVGIGSISVSASAASSVNASISGDANMISSSSGTSSASSAISGDGNITSIVTGTTLVTGNLTYDQANNLSGGSIGFSTVAGSLNAVGLLSGQSGGLCYASATLQASHESKIIQLYSRLNTSFKRRSEILSMIEQNSIIRKTSRS